MKTSWTICRRGQASIRILAALESVIIGAALFLGPATQAQQKQALLVYEGASMGVGDQAVVNRLTSLGFTVTSVLASSSTTANASGKDLVVVSSSVSSGNVLAKFRDVTVPVIAWENAIFDDMLFTLNGGPTDRGTITGQQTIQIVNSGHPLAAGLSGTVTLTSSAQTIAYGLPQSTATVIARSTDGNNRAVLFAFEKGALLIDGITRAAARRVVLPLDDATPANLTANGLALFDAAVNWASGPDTVKPTIVSATTLGRAGKVTVVFSEPVSDSSAIALANYSINNGVTVASVVKTKPDTVELSTSAITPGQSYVLTISGVQDTAASANTIVAGSQISIDTNRAGMWREVYYAIAGATLNDLTSASKFPASPDQVDLLTSLESTKLGENYGERLSGILVPPVTGSYTFYVAGDDECKLFLSTDASPVSKTFLGGEPQWSNSRDYSGTAGNGSGVSAFKKSAPISLVAEKGYYIEVLHKQGGGGGHVAVAWQKPGDPVPANGSAPIPGANLLVPVNQPPTLTPISDPAAILEDSGQQTISLAGITAGLAAGTANETWQNLTVSATSNNPGLIPDPTVTYTSPNATATLTYTPVPSANGTAVITVTVSDNGGTANGGVASFSRTFTVNVTAVNDAPSFAKGSDQKVSEDAGPQAVSNWATSISAGPSNESGQTLTFQASNDRPTLFAAQPSVSSTGTLTYTPAPDANGVATVTIGLRDDGGTANGGVSASADQTFTITISPVNDEPKLAPIPDYDVAEGAELSFKAEAFDVDGDALIFGLDAGAPEGATVDPVTGLFRWRPTEAQGPGSYTLNLRVKDPSNYQWVRRFQVRVNEVNDAPTVQPITNQELLAGETLRLQVQATDTDLPANQLTYSLGAGAPAGMNLDSATGELVWATKLAQSASTNAVTVLVSDNGTPSLSASVSFHVVVKVLNHAPVMASIPAQRVEAGQLLTVINAAGDIDGPSQVLNWSLDAGAPADMKIDANSGFIRWTPTAAGNYSATVRVSDNGSPSMSVTQKFEIAVTPGVNAPPTSVETSNPSAGTTAEKRPPIITAQPRSQAVNSGSSVTLTVAATGGGTLTYRWLFNGSPVADAAAAELALSNVQLANSGNYSVVVSNGDGSVTSSTAALTVVERPAKALVKGDFDGDGVSDLVFEDADGFLAAWLMSGATLSTARFLEPERVADKNYRIVGSGDFNKDAKEDLLFQHRDGTLGVWQMDGTKLGAASFLSPANIGDRNWRAMAVIDLNADGKPDVLFQHAEGTLLAWFMDGVEVASSGLLNPSSPGTRDWRVAGTGDFNRDGKPDLIFQHTDGLLAVWILDGTNLKQIAMVDPQRPNDGNWRVVSVADRNGDGKPDLLFQHAQNRTLAVWYLDGLSMTSAELLKPFDAGGSWKVVAP